VNLDTVSMYCWCSSTYTQQFTSCWQISKNKLDMVNIPVRHKMACHLTSNHASMLMFSSETIIMTQHCCMIYAARRPWYSIIYHHAVEVLKFPQVSNMSKLHKCIEEDKCKYSQSGRTHRKTKLSSLSNSKELPEQYKLP
jgi:hypothetical protein